MDKQCKMTEHELPLLFRIENFFNMIYAYILANSKDCWTAIPAPDGIMRWCSARGIHQWWCLYPAERPDPSVPFQVLALERVSQSMLNGHFNVVNSQL
ncbi:uncharacterized protein Dvir_GJ16524 [Drosophila virilis]|uniref:Uncharacterized protein n=1 Tax=Drosophila virilis TaxID=7244 RepID=B4M740_DROVI|nr:uncharacterized protein Dvir_GJ16524 [Drosophila virilis]